MSLKALQEAMGALLLQPEGAQVLQDDAQWQDFLKQDSSKALKRLSRTRLVLYEELLLNTVQDTLGRIHPYCRTVLEDLLGIDWLATADAYRRQHPNPSFQLHNAVSEFSAFLAAAYGKAQPSKPSAKMTASIMQNLHGAVRQFPFLPELARYEWLEVVVCQEPDQKASPTLQPDIPLDVHRLDRVRPYWNPHLRLQQFDYPIPAIISLISETPPAALKTSLAHVQPEPAQILIYRDPATLKARYFQLNPASAALLIKLINLSLPGKQPYLWQLRNLKQQEPLFRDIPDTAFYPQALQMLVHCQQAGILLGSLPAESPL